MNPIKQLRRHSFRFRHNVRGIAATEFALVAPMLLLLILGGFEFSRYMLIHQKTEKVAYTVSDVVSQNTSVTDAELTQISNAAAQIMAPYSFSSQGVVIVTSVYKPVGSAAKVNWRHSGGGALVRASQIGAVGGAATLPTGLELNDKDNVIVAEIYYFYTPLFGGSLIANGDIYKTAIFKPRLGALTTPPT